MKTFKHLKSALLLLVLSSAFISCKKSTIGQPITVTSCFENGYNGTYTGNGVASGTVFTNTAVIITKLSCASIKIESPKFNTITVSSLTASTIGNYSGTTASGSSLSLSFKGNDLSIGGNELSFNGSK